MLPLRDHLFVGTTQSLCPDCLQLVPAKIIVRDNRVFFRKRCPRHGPREDFVCSDAGWFDRSEHDSPGKLPKQFGTAPRRGCPYDCGLCSEHEQHTCIALLEITSSCNLTCPMCFAGSAPGGKHVSAADCKRAIDHLVRVEGRPEVLQLSGGEPTIHPDVLEILDHACRQPIDVVMVNTNGVRLARDARFLEAVAEYRDRAEIYLQFDGFASSHHEALRGKSLLETKLEAIDALGAAGLKTTLVCTLQQGVNHDQPGPIVRYAAAQPHVTGVSFQPATYTGRYVLPKQLEERITFPDVIQTLTRHTPEWLSASDFLPLPCAHPNAHTLAYMFRDGDTMLPLNRLVDLSENMDLLANGIVFGRDQARQMVKEFLSRACCAGGDCGPATAGAHRGKRSWPPPSWPPPWPTPGGRTAERFFAKAAAGRLQQSDLLRVTITSFMDAYNFDIRQLMRSCVHHLLPSGHLIPFSAYNVLYRDGHVPLPPLSVAGTEHAPPRTGQLPVVSGS